MCERMKIPETEARTQLLNQKRVLGAKIEPVKESLERLRNVRRNNGRDRWPASIETRGRCERRQSEPGNRRRNRGGDRHDPVDNAWRHRDSIARR